MNALIAMSNAPDIPRERFNAPTRSRDHNRAISQLAAKVGVPVTAITKMTAWGNHSATQYPDLFHAEVNGKNAAERTTRPDRYVFSSRPSLCAARPSSRPAGRARRRPRRTRPSSTCATGSSARPRATGCRWLCRPTAATASWEGLISQVPVHGHGRPILHRQGPRDRRLQPRQDRCLVAELADEKSAVTELGLIRRWVRPRRRPPDRTSRLVHPRAVGRSEWRLLRPAPFAEARGQVGHRVPGSGGVRPRSSSELQLVSRLDAESASSPIGPRRPRRPPDHP